jgi:hypothetical protein
MKKQKAGQKFSVADGSDFDVAKKVPHEGKGAGAT